MVVKMKRYYGDEAVTKSVVEVWMQGEEKPRMVCEAREPRWRDYAETFKGVKAFCLPRGRWRLAVQGTRYGAMTLVVQRCVGHVHVEFGFGIGRRVMMETVAVGMPKVAEGCEPWSEEDVRTRGIVRSEETFRRLEELTYEAFGKQEEMWMEIENSCCNAI